MVEKKITFRDVGTSGNAYIICEYHDATPVFYYKGYYDGKDTITLYPSHAVVKGERREKLKLNVRSIERGAR